MARAAAESAPGRARFMWFSVGNPLIVSSHCMKRLVAGLGVLALIVVSGCSPRYVRSAQPPVGTLPQLTVASHVLVVSVDGLRPDAINARETPMLFRLMQTGSYSLAATTIMPSNTLPS